MESLELALFRFSGLFRVSQLISDVFKLVETIVHASLLGLMQLHLLM